MSPEEKGQRLDLYLIGRGVSGSRNRIARLIRGGHVAVRGQAALKPGYRVRASDEIAVTPLEPQPSELTPESLPLSVVFEDDTVIVVNKAQGMVVHPAPGHRGGTLVNALLPRIGGGSPLRPGVVHRLDKGTSGLLVLTKTEEAYAALAAQFKAHSITRVYRALVHGAVRADSGTLAYPLGRHPVQRKKFAVVKGRGRPAVTRYRVAERFPGVTLLELRPETGRTHQIRVHLSALGHPILGDDLYGGKGREKGLRDPGLLAAVRALGGPALHAGVLGFVHPGTGRYVEFSAPHPPAFEDILVHLRSLR